MIMMIHYQILTQGKFYSYDIMIFYNHNSRIIQSLERLEFIESKWREFTSNNPKTFNGRLFRVDDYNILSSKNNLIELQLGNTDYKEFIGTQDPEFINRFGKKYTANPLSTGTVLVTQDNKIILGKRSSSGTDTGKNKISVIGGYLDPTKDLVNHNNTVVDTFHGIKREIFEETGIDDDKDIVDLACIGLFNNKEYNQINLPFILA